MISDLNSKSSNTYHTRGPASVKLTFVRYGLITYTNHLTHYLGNKKDVRAGRKSQMLAIDTLLPVNYSIYSEPAAPLLCMRNPAGVFLSGRLTR
jgi:hypothetical protein